jgi:hypothetical protein
MTTTPRRTDWTTRVGIAIVAASAIATSFSALDGLARAAGWSSHIGFALPLIVDTLGALGTKVWLSGPVAVRPLARRVAVLAIICSVSGNIAYHLLAAGLMRSSVWLVVIIGAVPPAALGLVGHLAASLAAAPAEPAEPAPAALGQLPAPEELPQPASAPLLPAPPAPALATGSPADIPVPQASPKRPAQPRKISSAIAGGDSWDELIGLAAEVNAVSLEQAGRPAGISKLTRELKIGQPKARALRDALAASTA